jgi:hypothetical protein
MGGVSDLHGAAGVALWAEEVDNHQLSRCARAPCRGEQLLGAVHVDHIGRAVHLPPRRPREFGAGESGGAGAAFRRHGCVTRRSRLQAAAATSLGTRPRRTHSHVYILQSQWGWWAAQATQTGTRSIVETPGGLTTGRRLPCAAFRASPPSLPATACACGGKARRYGVRPLTMTESHTRSPRVLLLTCGRSPPSAAARGH